MGKLWKISAVLGTIGLWVQLLVGCSSQQEATATPAIAGPALLSFYTEA